jgi:hypothetical protein
VQPVPQRRTPFAVEFPLNFTSEIEFLAPAGYEAELPASMNKESQSRFASWKLHSSGKAGGLHLDYELHLPAGRYVAAEYADYEHELEQSMAALTQNIVLKRTK